MNDQIVISAAQIYGRVYASVSGALAARYSGAGSTHNTAHEAGKNAVKGFAEIARELLVER